jgi:hypothetical protein
VIATGGEEEEKVNLMLEKYFITYSSIFSILSPERPLAIRH